MFDYYFYIYSTCKDYFFYTKQNSYLFYRNYIKGYIYMIYYNYIYQFQNRNNCYTITYH